MNVFIGIAKILNKILEMQGSLVVCELENKYSKFRLVKFSHLALEFGGQLSPHSYDMTWCESIFEKGI